MIITLKQNQLTVPASVQRQSGLKSGDRLKFDVAPRSITITVVDPPACKPTRAELAAIRKGEQALACGESVSLTAFLHDLDSNRRK